MPRLNVVEHESANGAVKETMDAVAAKMGGVPNIFKGMGNSNAALTAYLSMSEALSKGLLSPEDREIVYLAVSEFNGCHYCVSAHTKISKGVGLADEQIISARKFESENDAHAKLLGFVKRVIETKGFVEDADIESVKAAGYDDGQIAEAVGYIGLATYSNLFNHVFDTPLDFPAAPKL